jgi:hypothetical protein
MILPNLKNTSYKAIRHQNDPLKDVEWIAKKDEKLYEHSIRRKACILEEAGAHDR